jgi:hypothetical protein
MQRTRFFCRLIGLYCVLISLAMAAHRQETVDAVNSVVHNAPVLFVFSALTLIAGLAMVLSHNIWSGGTAPVAVTLVGWVVLIKALTFLFVSPPEQAGFFERLRYGQLSPVYTGIIFALGAYLTWGGFRTESH